MCGIFGAITVNVISDETIRLAHKTQKHRGPDAQGEWRGKYNNRFILLAHQRLAILDLSDAGNQPMVYQNEKGVLVYNGELYNYLEIRSELQKLGEVFSTKTDTEVILKAFMIWGVERSLKIFNGMWSIAFLDKTENKLYLSRDRTGEKPLYYYKKEKTIVFASEIKTILEIVGKKLTLDMQNVGLYLQQAIINSNNGTFFNEIKQLPPATFSVIDLNDTTITLNNIEYWRCPHEPDTDYSEPELKERIRTVLESSVKLRTRSDVPVGVLLSGGVDSSAISAILGKNGHLDKEITLLSAVSSDKRFDESQYIDIVGKHLDQPIHKVNLELNASNAVPLLEEVTWYNDEPVGSFSNISHYLLMKKAKDIGVTVILSGQGADELFCGYKKYLGFYVQWLLRKKKYISALKVLSSFVLNNTVINQYSIAEAKRYLPLLNHRSGYDIMGRTLNEYQHENIGLKAGSNIQKRQCEDLMFFSVPALNHYEDRMSMAASREIRLPFLDYRLIDLVAPLDVKYKLRNGWTKYMLRKAIADILPSEITWRKDKQGFVNPQSEWIKHELNSTINNYFNEESYIFKYDIINRKSLISMYNEYCGQKTGRGNISFRDIFSPLALEVWLRKYENYITF